MEDYWYETANSQSSEYEYEYVEEEEQVPDEIENLNAHPHQSNSPPVTAAENDSDIFLSTSINQSKSFLEQKLGLPVFRLSKVKPPGLIILRLEDFSQIRNTSLSHSKEIPHIIVIPQSNNFVRDHNDFTSALDLWYPRQ